MKTFLEKSFITFGILAANAAVADIKPGKLDLTKGPGVLTTYTNFYNDSDLSATCVVYTDSTAMLMADGIVPYRKPVFIKVPKARYNELKALVVETTRKLESPKEFSGYNAIPYGWKDASDVDMGALYFGKSSDDGPRTEMDLVRLKADSKVAELVRAICGYGDDL